MLASGRAGDLILDSRGLSTEAVQLLRCGTVQKHLNIHPLSPRNAALLVADVFPPEWSCMREVPWDGAALQSVTMEWMLQFWNWVHICVARDTTVQRE